METTRRIDGWSKSLWKSLAVKSLRMGWPAGLEAAERALNPSTLRSLLTCGVFEDTFPATGEIDAVLEAVDGNEYERLCRWETHHGRGYTDRFCDLEDEAVRAARQRGVEIFPRARELGIWIPPRALNCFWTWLKVEPSRGGTREIDPRPFEVIPRAMADGHTYEGKHLNQKVTVLSGHYQQHRSLGRRVLEEGWSRIREEVHGDLLPPPPAGQEELAL